MAESKLAEELDILEIIKKLRVHQFASQVTLKPHQRDLVNFFQEYKIYDPTIDVAPHISQNQEMVAPYELNEEASPQDQRETAVEHLYRSIACLEPATDATDARIIARVTKPKRTPLELGSRAMSRRPTDISAQDVM